MKKLAITFVTTTLSIGAALPGLSNAETLPDAVQKAIQFNPDVLFQAARRLASEEGVQEARGALFPSVDVRAGVGREKSRSPSTRAINPGDSDTVTLGRQEASIELTQNLFAGGAVMGEIKRNEEAQNAEGFKLEGVADDVALTVSERYLDILKGHQRLALAQKNLSDHEEILGMIRQRSTAGVSREAELEQAKGRLALAQANLVSEHGNLREAYIGFQRNAGYFPRHLKWPRMPSSKDLPNNLQHGIDLALTNHPTLKSAYSDVEEAKAQHRVALGTNYPRVDLVLSAGRNEDLDGLVGINQENLAMLRMSYNLFRGGSDLARQRRTAYQIQEAYEVKNNSTAQVKESMRLSWNSLRVAQDRLNYLRSYRDSSNNTLDAYNEQFKVGNRTLLDLLDTVNENYQAKLDYLDGLYIEAFSRYRVLNSMGRLVPYLGAYIPVEVYNTDELTSHERYQHGKGSEEEINQNKFMEENILTTNTFNRFASASDFKALSDTVHKNVELAALTTATRDYGDELAGTKKPAPAAELAKMAPKAGAAFKPELAKNQKAKKSTQVLAKSHWILQAGAFSEHGNADRLVKKLKSQGYEQAFMVDSGRLHYVYIGPFDNKAQAGAGNLELTDKLGIKSLVRFATVKLPKSNLA